MVLLLTYSLVRFGTGWNNSALSSDKMLLPKRSHVRLPRPWNANGSKFSKIFPWRESLYNFKNRKQEWMTFVVTNNLNFYRKIFYRNLPVQSCQSIKSSISNCCELISSKIQFFKRLWAIEVLGKNLKILVYVLK